MMITRNVRRPSKRRFKKESSAVKFRKFHKAGSNILPKRLANDILGASGSSLGQMLASFAGAIQKNIFRNL